MRIIKNITTAIDIPDPIALYTDIEANLLMLLNAKYTNRCYDNCYIEKVNSIKKYGECTINQDGPADYGTLSVIFEVSAVVYLPGELIHGCVMRNRDKMGIITADRAGSAPISCMVRADKSYESVTAGQLISIRVTMARYSQSSSIVSINAIPFMFTGMPKVYSTRLGTLDHTLLEDVRERVAAEETARASLDKKAWDVFNQLIYAYKTPQKPPTGAVINHLNTIVDSNPTTPLPAFLCRDTRADLSTDIVYAFAEKTYPPEYKLVDNITVTEVMIQLFEDYYSYLRTIREMIEIYNTDKLKNDHMNIWQIFKKNKM